MEFKPDLTKTLSVVKRGFNHDNFIQTVLPMLYPNGKAISKEKKADLLELLKFIPTIYHKFYTNLEHCEQTETNQDGAIIISDNSDEELIILKVNLEKHSFNFYWFDYNTIFKYIFRFHSWDHSSCKIECFNGGSQLSNFIQKIMSKQM